MYILEVILLSNLHFLSHISKIYVDNCKADFETSEIFDTSNTSICTNFQLKFINTFSN